MKNHAESIEKALGYYRSAAALNALGRRAAGHDLHEDACWSTAQIAAILNVSPSTAYGWGLAKSDKTGGRFAPETLPLLLELSDLAEAGRPSGRLEALIVEAGTSPIVIARLTGEYEIDVRRRIRQARKVAADAGASSMAEHVGYDSLGRFGGDAA